MNRRKFLNNSTKACASALLVEQLLTQNSAFSQTALLNALAAQADSCSDNILVLVQLFGGNDGLNTFIPLDAAYDVMSNKRSNVTIAKSNLKFATSVNSGQVTLGSRSSITTKYTDLAFHPAMEGAYNLFEANKLSLVMGCSYDKPDFSHFRGTDIWMMGADSNEFLKSGWIGRELESQYSNVGFPDPTALTANGYPDPLCVNMGSIAPLTFNASTGVGAGVSVSTINNDYPLLGGFGDAAPTTCAGDELSFLRQAAIDTDKYNAKIVAAAKAQASNMSTKYGSDSLSSQLKNVARLIKGGLKTRVYQVSLGGFDTHTSQVGSNKYDGNHAGLLWNVSKALEGFQDDLEKMGVADKVMGMVFTEFGRTVNSNGGGGTDHGRSTPVWVFGNSLKGGRYGTNPKLTNPTTGATETQVPMQFDYRSVYYTLLKQWFGLAPSQMDSVFGGATKVAKYAAQEHDLIINAKRAEICQVTSVDDFQSVLGSDILSDVYPNPVEDTALIPFRSEGGYMKLELFDVNGSSRGVMLEADIPLGDHQYRFERNGLKSGVYVVKMRNSYGHQGSKKLVLK